MNINEQIAGVKDFDVLVELFDRIPTITLNLEREFKRKVINDVSKDNIKMLKSIRDSPYSREGIYVSAEEAGITLEEYNKLTQVLAEVVIFNDSHENVISIYDDVNVLFVINIKEYSIPLLERLKTVVGRVIHI